MDISVPELLVVLGIMSAGTVLQSTVGFGLGMFAGPILVLIDRAYMPGPMLFAALVMTAWLTLREYRAVDLREVGFSVAGRVLSTPLAALAVGYVSVRLFDLLFGILILVAVAISLVHRNIKPTPRNVFLAGLISGFMSTICAIGGPPLALVYQNTSGTKLRATLSAMFLVGCVMSVTALAIVGEFGTRDLARTGLLTTGVVLGLVISRPLAGILKDRTIRNHVLAVCTASAVIVLLRALLQYR